MSIDDDFFDMAAFVEDRKVYPEWEGIDDTWDRLGTYMRDIELENETIRKRNRELEITIKTMMGLKSPTKRGPSPYDASIDRRKRK